MGYRPSDIDKLLHHPTRFGVAAHLVRSGGSAPFCELVPVLDIRHPGALSHHLRVLEGVGFIRVRKAFVGRKTRTTFIITPKGLQAFADHLKRLGTLSHGVTTPLPMEAPI